MKTSILMSIVILLASTSIFAQSIQQKDVPSAVIVKLHEMHPNVKSVQWEKHNNDYKAFFTENDSKYTIRFDERATRHETVIRIKEESLPVNAHSYLSRLYPSTKFEEIEKHIDRHGVSKYKVKTKDKVHHFDENGRHIEL